MTQYIHVRNWERYQHADTKRTQNPDRAMAWIKDYTCQLTELSYLTLSYADRGLLQSVRLQYALNRGDGIEIGPGTLNLLLGQRVSKQQVERLSDAGFIVVSACKVLADCLHDARLDLDLDKDQDNNLATASRESDSSDDPRALQQPSFVPVQATNGAGLVAPAESDPDADIPLLAAPANGRHLELVPAAALPDINARPRDDIWDLLEIKFGPVGAKGSNAHAKRNKACADLRRAGATVELVRAACDRWPAVFASATLTDAALATHYPLLAVPLLAKASRPAPCAECELGGGLHLEGCSRAVA